VVRNQTVEYRDRTKTKKSTGTFPLLEDVKEALLELKAQQTQNRKAFGNTYHESDYVFVWKNGNLYNPDYITRSFVKELSVNKLPYMRFHDLRHSTASILHDKGWSLKDIQDWLRHVNIETTGNIYTHISEQRKQSVSYLILLNKSLFGLRLFSFAEILITLARISLTDLRRPCLSPFS
jgi:integrase